MQPSPFTLRTAIYPEIDPARLGSALVGQTALVTGSGRGIGREMALALAKAGANVVVTGRTPKEVDQTTNEINALEGAHGTAYGIVANVLDRADLQRLVDESLAKLGGGIDILVCNAGSNLFQPFHLTDATEWWDLMELNVRAPVELTRLVLPQMRARNKGTLIYTSSRAATADLPWTTAYNCAKTAITRFAGTLQVEVDQLPALEDRTPDVANAIRCYSIHPGEIETSLHDTAFPARTKEKAPYVIEHMAKIGAKRPHYEGVLPAWTVVWLCVPSDAREALKGKYVDCTRDVAEQAKAVAGKL